MIAFQTAHSSKSLAVYVVFEAQHLTTRGLEKRNGSINVYRLTNYHDYTDLSITVIDLCKKHNKSGPSNKGSDPYSLPFISVNFYYFINNNFSVAR